MFQRVYFQGGRIVKMRADANGCLIDINKNCKFKIFFF